MATISAITTFDLSTSPKTVRWVDTTDWAGQGIPLANVNGSFKITAPSGIVTYNNVDYTNGGCDIDINNSLSSQQTVQLPLDTNGDVEQGTYTILYTVYNSVALVYYTQSYSFTFEYESPEITITQVADCVSPAFTSTDATDYAKDGATLSMVRVHELHYPYGSAGEASPIVSNVTTIATSTFYNGTQTTEIESALTYTFSDGLIVYDIVNGSKEIPVDCKYLCGITCCITSLETLMNNAKCTNEVLFKQYENTFQQVMAYMGLIKFSLECGLNDKINGYLTKIKEIANCTDDCTCSDTPSQVVGLGFSNLDVVVTTCGNGIEVTPSVIGETTSYRVCLSTAILNLINSIDHTVVVNGNNITVSAATGGNTTTFTVNGEATVVTSTDLSVTITPSGPVAGVTTYDLSVPAASVVVADGESTAPIQSFTTSGVYVAMTGATHTITTNGDYLFSGEIALEMWQNSNILVAFHVNGVLAGIARSWGDVASTNSGATRCTYSYVIQEKLTGLVATDIVTLRMRAVLTSDPIVLYTQSVQYLKIA